MWSAQAMRARSSMAAGLHTPFQTASKAYKESVMAQEATSSTAQAARTQRSVFERLALLLERESVLGYLLLLPASVLLLVFVAYPLVYGIWLSFTDMLIGVPGNFIGLANYAELLRDSTFHQTVRNSFVYTAVTTVFKLTGGLIMAVILNTAFRGRRLVRAMLLLPWIVPTVLSTLAWLWMFDSTFSVFNWLLRQVGITGPIWLGDGYWPMISLMLVNIWRGMPFFGVSFLAGMQSISQEYYEAATIDGASAWHKFWQITMPLLQPVIAVVLLLSIILTLADFQLIYVLTRGGPANSTHVFSTYAFQLAVPGTQLGLGAAVSVFMFPILAVIVFFTLVAVRKEQE
jgi:multiple sugar transport system permease protein